MELTHINDQGNARMVDISDKNDTKRTAIAQAKVIVNRETMQHIKNGAIKKGDVLAVAQVAGITAAKKTFDLIPMAHIIPLTFADIKYSFDDTTIYIESTVKTNGKTGAEMEALTAVSVCALTIYDMCKAVQKDIKITDIMLKYKSGGKSGEYANES